MFVVLAAINGADKVGASPLTYSRFKVQVAEAIKSIKTSIRAGRCFRLRHNTDALVALTG